LWLVTVALQSRGRARHERSGAGEITVTSKRAQHRVAKATVAG